MATPKKGSGGPGSPADPPQTLAETRPVETAGGPYAREYERTAADTVANRIAPAPDSVAGTLREVVGGRHPTEPRNYTLRDLPGLATSERFVTLRRPEGANRDMETLWWAINIHTEALSFKNYSDFIFRVLCQGEELPAEGTHLDAQELRARTARLRDVCHVPGAELYQLLKLATEAYLVLNCGICPDDDGGFSFGKEPTDPTAALGERVGRIGSTRTLSQKEARDRLATFLGEPRNNYLETVLGAFPRREVTVDSPFCLAGDFRLDAPCLLELIWSYWMEEGMLTQTIATITRRFQNVRRPGRGPDPLAELELDPLRRLGAILWGYLQDEPNRLSVVRRAYEYNHHYGLTLVGRAVPQLRPADSRFRFLEAFHDLLREAARFYREDNDTTVIADAFPVLNSLREVHLLLSEGAHNQFRDLPWQSRAEMLLQQWILARPEMREFLRGRYMVAYPEEWMGAVDSMKKLQGWTDTSVRYFRDLARFGERILLTIRYGNWSDVNDQEDARAWLRYWKEEIQGYIHAYHTATGVNLSDDVVEVRSRTDLRYMQPSFHLRNRVMAERRARRLPR